MKVLMFTVHRTLNYGTVLQTYACNRIFKKLGCDLTIADYARPKDYSQESVHSIFGYIRLRKRIKSPNSLRLYLKLILTSLYSYKFTKKFWNNCNAFLQEHIKLSVPLYSESDIFELSSSFDILCAGSDQIWNSDYNGGTDKIYLLGFDDTSKKKISLSSSIGKDNLNSTDCEMFSRYLNEFNAISVRENKAKELLAGIGIHSAQLIDPTLWLSANEWDEEVGSPIISEPYLLLYKLKADNLIDSVAEGIAAEMGIKIVRVCFSKLHRKNNMTKDVILPKVSEFLSLIKNAKFVVTNSFHGTCFCINFNKPFYSVARGKYNSRIESILKVVGLENRFVLDSDSLSAIDSMDTIDFESVNNILSQRRNEGYSWLRSAISEK